MLHMDFTTLRMSIVNLHHVGGQNMDISAGSYDAYLAMHTSTTVPGTLDLE